MHCFDFLGAEGQVVADSTPNYCRSLVPRVLWLGAPYKPKGLWAVLPYPRRRAVCLEIAMIKLRFETFHNGKGKKKKKSNNRKFRRMWFHDRLVMKKHGIHYKQKRSYEISDFRESDPNDFFSNEHFEYNQNLDIQFDTRIIFISNKR